MGKQQPYRIYMVTRERERKRYIRESKLKLPGVLDLGVRRRTVRAALFGPPLLPIARRLRFLKCWYSV